MLDTIYDIVGAISALIGAGAVVRLIILGIQMAMETEDKSPYVNEIKHVFIVLVISILITGLGITPLLLSYFNREYV